MMLVVEKIFGIIVNGDSNKEDLCRILAMNNCFDRENYKINNKLDCEKECKFFDVNGRCTQKIYDWLMSEYQVNE